MEANTKFENEEILKEQIEKIRLSGKTNMFDSQAVQYLAFDDCMTELVLFIADHKQNYINYIFTGSFA